MTKLLKPFLYAQYIWKPITEMYIASPPVDKCQKNYIKYITPNWPDGRGELALRSWRFGRDSGELVAGSGELAEGSGEMVGWRNDL